MEQDQYEHVEVSTRLILSGAGLSWRAGRVILDVDEPLIPEMDTLAYAEVAGMPMRHLAEILLPDAPAEWLLGMLQTQFRGILEAFVNHHDLGLDGRPSDDPKSALLGDTAALCAFLDALGETGVDVGGLIAAIGAAVAAGEGDYEVRAAEMLAGWYRLLPEWAAKVARPGRKIEVHLPESLAAETYGHSGEPVRQAVVDFAAAARGMVPQPFRWLFVHGSYATEDYVALSSDLDTFGIICAEIVADAERLMRTRQDLLGLWPIFYRIDPLQHHGVLCAAEQDLAFFPQPFFPVLLIHFGRTLIGSAPMAIEERDSLYLRRYILYRVRQYFRWHICNFPDTTDAFAFKHLVNMLLLAPALILQRNGNYRYKRETFPAVHALLPKEMSETLNRASRIRAEALYRIDAPPVPAFQSASKEQILEFSRDVRQIPTPAEAREAAGPLFAQKARELVDFLVDQMEGDDRFRMALPVKKRESHLPEEPCLPIPLETYDDCFRRAKEVFFARVPADVIATFGSVSAPGISDLDFVVACDDPEIHGQAFRTLHENMLQSHHAMKDVLLHPVSMILPASMRAEIGKLYPIFGDVDWHAADGTITRVTVDDTAFAAHQLAALAELATMYFLRHDLADHFAQVKERSVLLRANGIKHSHRVLKNNGWMDPGIEVFSREVDDYRLQLFDKTAEERSVFARSLVVKNIAAQLAIFEGIRQTLPNIVDCRFLENLPAGKIVGVWAADTWFVVGWTPQVALNTMIRSLRGCGRLALVLPAEIALLFAAYSRRPNAFRSYLVSRFVDCIPTGPIRLHGDIEERLTLIDRHLDFLMAGQMEWGCVPHLAFNPLAPFWGSPGWRADALHKMRGADFTIERLMRDYYLAGQQETRLRAMIDGGKATEVEPEARRFAENTGTPVAQYFHGLTLAALGRYREAITAFDKAIAVGYDPVWGRYNRAQCLLQVGQLAAAQADLDQVRAMNSNIPGLATVQEWIDAARHKIGETTIDRGHH